MGELTQNKTFEFSNPQMDIIETTAQKVLMQCGVGSGKSHCIGMISANFVTQNPEVRGFIGANTYQQLSKSTLDKVFKAWQDVYGWVKNIHFVVDRKPPEGFPIIGPELKSYENTILFNNGALIFLASLDNYKVIDGTEFGWACLDETKDTKEIAIKEVIIARLRQLGMMVSTNGKVYATRKYNSLTNEIEDLLAKGLKTGKYQLVDGKYYRDDFQLTGYTPLYIFTSPAKERWLMEWFNLDEDAELIERKIYDKDDYFRKRKGNQFVVIASSWHNAHNLSPGFIERVIEGHAGNMSKINMLVYGSPFGKSGGEYYSAYKRLKHVKDFDIWQDEPIHLAFDFNWVPYMTCTTWQMKFNNETKRYLVRCFDEFCLANPDNNTPALCKAVIKKYEHLLKIGMFYYGDYNGKAGRTISEEFKNEYAVIEYHFKPFMNNNSDRVITNTLHKYRRDFMNNMLEGVYPIDIEIHTRCKELRADFEFIKEDPNGAKLKTKITVDGVSFEEHGHTSDSADSLFTSAFNNIFLQYKQNY